MKTLDRISPSHGEGRRFNPCRAHHFPQENLSETVHNGPSMAGTDRETGGKVGENVASTFALIFALLTASPAHAADLIGRASVIDGDTIEIQGTRIRLHGVDAPESRQECHVGGKAWRCGQQAALALSDWLGASTVSCQQVAVDRYKRIVARCSKGEMDLGSWLVSNGWALDYPRYSEGYYVRDQESAKAGKRGVWRGEVIPPWEWRKR